MSEKAVNTPEGPESPERPHGGAPLEDAEEGGLLEGTIERVTYHDEQSLYTVLRLNPESGYVPEESLGLFPTRITAVGRAPRAAEGLRVRLRGSWTEHPTHGRQFAFEALEVMAPEDAEGLVRYLASGVFEGIGLVLARRIVDALGPGTLEEILKRPEALERVKGLRAAVRERLVETVRVELGTHQVHAFLRGLGLGPLQSAAVLAKLGLECEAIIVDDPFVLAAGIRGIGFAIADRAAASLDLAEDDPRRLRAGLVHSMGAAAEDGHTLVSEPRLLELGRELLHEVPPGALESALAELAAHEELVLDTPPQTTAEGEHANEPATGPRRVYLPGLFHCETRLARNLTALLECRPARPLTTPERLAHWESLSGITLHERQRAAILGLLSTPVGLLTGGPGVGKTTIVRAVVDLALSAGSRVMLASPTGRAAKRLAEATGHVASTVHRLLGYEPATGGFAHDHERPLEGDLIVVDEISMLDVRLAHHLVKAVQPPTRLLFVGDPDQLPSVGPGNVLADLIASETIPLERLTRIYRQEAGSLIVENAHRILAGEALELPERGDKQADFYFFPAEDLHACAERMIEVVTKRIPQNFGHDWIEDVQVISPMYRGACGVDALNERLREAQNVGGLEVRRGGRVWRTGDRVIHTRNNYEKEVFNGDMGRIVKVNEDGSLTVRFPERDLVYAGGELTDLQPAFAITVHRSQGGEFPVVVMPLVPQHAVMLQRHLLYTAVTRARRLVVLVGSKRALRMALDNAEQSRRGSALAERMRGEEPGASRPWNG